MPKVLVPKVLVPKVLVPKVLVPKQGAICGYFQQKTVLPDNELVNLVDQVPGAAWREKSFGQRFKFGLPGGKFVPLGPRTIFLGRPKHRMRLPISRMSHIKH